MNVYEKLKKQSTLSTVEKEVANYILSKGELVLHMSVHTIAKQTFTSSTTIIRLCKKLGCSGFKEFKLQFSKDLRSSFTEHSNIDINAPFSEQDSQKDIATKIAILTKETVISCQATLNMNNLDYAVDKILSAKSIIAIGVSDSFIRIIDFQNKMLKINIFVKVSYLQPDQTYLCTHATEDDVALLISYSGTTAEVINEAKILKQRNVTTIGITSNTSSPLAHLCDIVILLPNGENIKTATYSFASQIAIEYVLNVLYSCIYKRNYEKNKDHLQQSREKYLHL